MWPNSAAVHIVDQALSCSSLGFSPHWVSPFFFRLSHPLVYTSSRVIVLRCIFTQVSLCGSPLSTEGGSIPSHSTMLCALTCRCPKSYIVMGVCVWCECKLTALHRSRSRTAFLPLPLPRRLQVPPVPVNFLIQPSTFTVRGWADHSLLCYFCLPHPL